MSLEESMSTLAESNLKLAAAMTNYANVMQSIASSNPGAIVAAPAGAAAETTGTETSTKATGKRRTKAEIAADAAAEVAANNAAADEVDPFAEEAPAKPVTAEDIRTLIMGVKAKDTAAALEIIKSVGAATLSQIAEKDFDKVVAACAKHGVTL